MTRAQALAWVLAVPAAAAVAVAFLWLFGIDVASTEVWMTFPDGWTIYMFIRHAFAILFFAGLVRAAQQLICDLWLERRNRPIPLPGDQPDD